MSSKKNPLYLLMKWIFLGVLMGVIGGLMGAFFHHSLHFVTHIRQHNGWLIWLLPVGGCLSVAVYGLVGVVTSEPLSSSIFFMLLIFPAVTNSYVLSA